ncbi:hypothetical protein ACI3KS_08170 [Microbacterium sp. ZW T5_45]|uniref:hypothetical protein n=1 Tax=Microbacterium sp. ZW T5_45 TaxID=3378080 RepID=UPI003852AEC4
MRKHTNARLRWLAITAAVATPLIALSTPAAAVAAPDDGDTVAAGDDWSVVNAAGGYLVTFELDEPLPIVSDAPTLLADGEVIGLATESDDGRSLRVFTNDPRVTTAEDVEKGWASGDSAKAAEDAEAERVVDEPNQELLDQLSRIDAAPEVADPSDPGEYTVTEAEYDFGDRAIALSGISGIRGEVTGKMYLTSAAGERPTVVLLHGRHGSCATSGTPANRWPCAPSQVNVRSYQGYEGTGRALASHGYNVLSIAANAVNSNDNQLALDYGAKARGQLILDTLEMLEKASSGAPVAFDDISWPDAEGTVTTTTRTLDEALVYATTRRDAPAPAAGVTASALVGRFDLDRVGIMGHSRGGEGATSAVTLNQAKEDPFGIVSVLPLAPVDFGRMTVPDVPMAVFLPYCDGDVSNQQGQHMIDDSRHAFGDEVMRSAVWVMGANHNFFNTVWTPGLYPYSTSDDWSASDRTSSCSTSDASRLSPSQQYQVGVSYMTGFFRLTIGGESEFQPLFDGAAAPSTTGTTYADVRVMTSQPTSATSLVSPLNDSSSLVRAAGNAAAQVCANAETATSIAPSVPYCTVRPVGTSRVPHWTPVRFGLNVPAYPVTRFTWTGSTSDPSAVSNGQLIVTVPERARDASDRTQLTVKTAPDIAVPLGTDFTITVVDGQGRTFSRAASEVNPLAVNRMPGGTHTTLNKVVLQQLTIPTADMTGIDLSDVREVRFSAGVGADGTGAGGIYLSDLAFDTPTSTPAVIETRTTVNIAKTWVEEGDAPDVVDVAVYLNRPESTPVTTGVSFVPTAGPVAASVSSVTFEPGETCKSVSVPITGNTDPSGAASTAITVSATNTTTAVMGANAFNTLNVREDDGLTSGAELGSPVGFQGDVCAELAASRESGELDASQDAVAPGGHVSFTARGYRAGEAVAFTYRGDALATVVADADGVAEASAAVPEDSELGSVEATATGVGSARVQSVVIDVLAPTATALTLAEGQEPTEGEDLTLIATVSGAVTDGSVTFSTTPIPGAVDALRADSPQTALGTADVADGVATFTLVGGLPAGEHAVVATFERTATASASSSEPLVFEVAAAPVTEQPGTESPEPTDPGGSSSGSAGSSGAAGSSTDGAGAGVLAATGAEIAVGSLLAAVALLLGGTTILVARRRRSAASDS